MAWFDGIRRFLANIFQPEEETPPPVVQPEPEPVPEPVYYEPPPEEPFGYEPLEPSPVYEYDDTIPAYEPPPDYGDLYREFMNRPYEDEGGYAEAFIQDFVDRAQELGYDETQQQDVIDLVWEGFLYPSEEEDHEDRMAARDLLYEWLEMVDEDVDWYEFREAYSEVNG